MFKLAQRPFSDALPPAKPLLPLSAQRVAPTGDQAFQCMKLGGRNPTAATRAVEEGGTEWLVLSRGSYLQSQPTTGGKAVGDEL